MKGGVTLFACICAAATESEVRDCVRLGALTVEEIGDACGAGTGCGSCVNTLGVLLMTTAAPSDLDGLPATA
ncbi:bacterioferritin-associated ferredoxin [Pseudonocardia sediminis]|uniref:Bacterioferritin-associated ferredoxin n=1 Tax=Pseudonocardia sediminis TaxID=1397368 RepID=A0A4Q7UXB6_PSEST|nr:(2Fe-2S)-binding protein [Pseudonocardia sediminis]RZT86425.1 bacterioferritin-associated ferredoxin [Pseudonocardia sediminis]